VTLPISVEEWELVGVSKFFMVHWREWLNLHMKLGVRGCVFFLSTTEINAHERIIFVWRDSQNQSVMEIQQLNPGLWAY
jgi:hypothetical protein